MLWITGSFIMLAWLVLAVFLHKGGYVHILLLTAITFYVTQFVQDRRTRSYKSGR
jgi:hypothetical protein